MTAIILKIVLIILAIGGLVALLHFGFSATLNPRYFLEFTGRLQARNFSVYAQQDLSVKGKIYIGFVLIGAGVIAFTGFKQLLFWIPDSWGQISEGEFHPLKDTIAALFAFLSFGLLAHLETSASRSLLVEHLNSEVKRLEQELTATKAKPHQFLQSEAEKEVPLRSPPIADQMNRVLVDSCVFINALKDDSDHRDQCLAFLNALSQSKQPMTMPAHGWFEVWSNLKRIEHIDKQFKGVSINGEWTFPIELIHIDDSFIKKYGNIEIPYIKAGDHIYLVVAHVNKYPLVTTDNGMAKVAKKIGISVFTPSDFVAQQGVPADV